MAFGEETKKEMANWQSRYDAVESKLWDESEIKASLQQHLARLSDEVIMLKFDLGDCRSC